MGPCSAACWQAFRCRRAAGAPHPDLPEQCARPAGAARARPGPRRDPSGVVRLSLSMITPRLRLLAAAWILVFALMPARLAAQFLLVPMDDEQRNHLKAYGLTYNAIKDGLRAEWFLNYRGGSFLLPDAADVRRRAGLDGVTVEPISASKLGAIRAEIAGGNMDAIPLEKAPRVAIYTPPNAPPWDDAVTLALRYAGIEYATVFDEEVVNGDLAKYDWLHLHHEDFTGQFSKFHIAYRGAPWFIQQVQTAQALAQRLGFPNPPALKKAVAERMRQYVENGGFLFAMC